MTSLARRSVSSAITAWRNFILCDHDIGRTYALQLIDRVDVHAEGVVSTPKEHRGRKYFAMLAATA